MSVIQRGRCLHEDIVRSIVHASRIVPHPGGITESVSVAVHVRREPVANVDSKDTEFGQSMQFARFAAAVVIRVDPNDEVAEDAVAGIDKPVAVAPVLRIIEHGERPESIALRPGWLQCHLPKQLGEIIDQTVPVPVERQPAVVPVCIGPANFRDRVILEDLKLTPPAISVR